MGIYELIIIAGVLAVGIFWVWMVIDCATQETPEGNDKVVWILIIVLMNWLGALIYYFVRRRKRIAEYDKQQRW